MFCFGVSLGVIWCGCWVGQKVLGRFGVGLGLVCQLEKPVRGLEALGIQGQTRGPSLGLGLAKATFHEQARASSQTKFP